MRFLPTPRVHKEAYIGGMPRHSATDNIISIVPAVEMV